MSDRTFEQFIEALPEGRQGSVQQVWRTIRDNAQSGVAEEITDKFLILKAGNEWLVALGSNKNYLTLHLTPLYIFPDLRDKWDAATKTNKKIKTGKGCVNFQSADDLPLALVGEIVADCDGETYLRQIQAFRNERENS